MRAAPKSRRGPIVDAHHHLWVGREMRYAVDDLRADMATVPGVERTVYVECGLRYRRDGPESFRPVGETEYVVAADPTGLIGAIVGFADLRAPDVADVLAAHVEAGRGRFRGIRQGAAWDGSPDIRPFRTHPPSGLLADARFRRGFAALGRVGLRFDAWVFHPQLPELADLCRAHPDVPVVLDHLGGPLGVGPYAGRRLEVFSDWRTSMAAVAACDNVAVKLGGIGMPMHGMRSHRQGGATVEELVETWRAPIRWCIEAFGVGRCMFESNFPVDKPSFSYAELWAAFDTITEDATPTERSELFAGTAVRTYGLDQHGGTGSA